jgi:hypothetical protein
MSLKNWGYEPHQLLEIQRFCKFFPKDAEKSCILSLQNDIKKISSQQQKDAPRRTGFMAQNTVPENLPNGAQAVSKAEYAIFVDQGTYRMPARPFFSSQVSKSMPTIENNFFNAFVTTVNRYLGSGR